MPKLIHHAQKAGPKSPLSSTYAVKHVDEEMVHLLLQYGVDVNSHLHASQASNGPLHIAVSAGSTSIVKLLVAGGLEVDAKGLGGATPLHAAANNGHMVRLLLKHRAAVDAGTTFGRTSLHYAAPHHVSDALEDLLKNGADVDASDNDEERVLHHAARWDSEAVIGFLIAYCADMSKRNCWGRTPIEESDQLTSDVFSMWKKILRSMEMAMEKAFESHSLRSG